MKTLRVILVCLLCSLLVGGNGWAATTAPVTVTATIATANRDITAAPTALTWDMPAGTITAHRFNSPLITITFYGGNQAGGYKIRAYTQNAPVGDGRGYLVKGTDKLYLKIWCANFGPRVVTNPPDPNSAYFWTGYDFNGDGDKSDWGRNGTLTGQYSEVTLNFDINGDGDKLDIITVAGSGDDPDTFTSIRYWLGESPSFSWLADQPTLATYEARLSSDIEDLVNRLPGPLGSPFKVVFATDVEGIVSGTYTAAGTGVMFDIVVR